MQEGARNSLLKILEEPPVNLTVVLTSAAMGAVIPTIQSRLRPYRFVQRDEAAEADVIRRIFRGPQGPGLQGPSAAAYLDSFLPVPDEKLVPLAACFIASLARSAAVDLRRRGSPLPPPLVALGKHTAATAGESSDSLNVIAKVLEGTANFQGRSFPRFLAAVLDLVSASARESVNSPGWIVYNEVWRDTSRRAAEAVGVWNQTPALALERMARELRGAMAG
jgi:DNA polymerase-3 subunit gamma/tau